MKTSLYLLALIMLLAAPAHAEVTYTLDEDYGNVPVTFVPNVGQFDEGIVFAAEGNNGGVFNDDEGLIFELAPELVQLTPTVPPGANYDFKIYLQFRDPNANPEVTYEDQAPWNNNYFIGNDSAQWHTDVPNYRTVRFSDIYHGIDLCMTGDGRRIESSLVIGPHVDPSVITFNERGITGTDEDGNLLGGWITEFHGSKSYVEPPPACVQYIDGDERVVDLTYKIIDVPDDYNDIVTFDIGEYDPAHELIIKPGPVYSQQMLIKDSGQYSTGIADLEVDNEGCAYVAGKGGYIHPYHAIGMNALFALKLNEAGDELGYVTYFTGISNNASINDIDIDSKRNLYLAGWAGNEAFPITENAYDKVNDELGKAFVLKMSQNGNEIEYSTYLGGNDIEYIHDMSLTEVGHIYITGRTTSWNFPVTNGAFDEEFNTKYENGFISILSSDGSELVNSTFIDIGRCETIEVYDSEVFIGGEGLGDAFICKLNSDLSDTVYTVWFGGSSEEYLTGMDIDDDGAIYVTGNTESEDFSTTDGSEYGGEEDCYAVKVDNNGSCIWSKLIGGSYDDAARGIQVDHNGTVYISGKASTTDFPVTPTGEQGSRVFLTVINTSRADLIFSSTFGDGFCDGLSLKNNRDVLIWGHSGINWPDNIINEGYYYLIKMDYSGETSVFNDTVTPDTFQFYPAYPNPFNPSVTLSYYLPYSEEVTVTIYNLQGQVVDTIVNEYQSAGYHTVTWDAEGFASGVYLYHITTKNIYKTGKLLRMK